MTFFSPKYDTNYDGKKARERLTSLMKMDTRCSSIKSSSISSVSWLVLKRTEKWRGGDTSRRPINGRTRQMRSAPKNWKAHGSSQRGTPHVTRPSWNRGRLGGDCSQRVRAGKGGKELRRGIFTAVVCLKSWQRGTNEEKEWGGEAQGAIFSVSWHF